MKENKEIGAADSNPAEPALPGTEALPKVSKAHKLRTTFMAGITVIAPLWITGMVLWWLFNLADKFSRPLIRPVGALLGDADMYHRGIGFLLTLLIVWVVGIITTNVFGRRLLRDAREALERLPLVRTIYAPIQKLMETMTSPESAGFKKVVLFEYPRRGLWTLGFVAGDVPAEGDENAAHSVFVPTAPNPTTGFMLIIPRPELRHTNLTIETAFQMIVSAGVAVPVNLRLPADIVSAGGNFIEANVIADASASLAQPAEQTGTNS